MAMRHDLSGGTGLSIALALVQRLRIDCHISQRTHMKKDDHHASYRLSCSPLLSGCFFIKRLTLRPRPEPLEEQVIAGEGKDKIVLMDITGMITTEESAPLWALPGSRAWWRSCGSSWTGPGGQKRQGAGAQDQQPRRRSDRFGHALSRDQEVQERDRREGRRPFYGYRRIGRLLYGAGRRQDHRAAHDHHRAASA